MQPHSRNDLTTRSRARSNTALFQVLHGDQAYLSTFEDETRAAPRFPRAQSYARRTGGAAQPAGTRPAPARAVAASEKAFGLSRARRLTRKADFERLLRSGARRGLAGYVFYIERREAGVPRLGMLVSRKHSKAATQRNGIKRCIREAFRLEQGKLGPIDVLVRPPYGIRPSPDMIVKLRELLARLSA
jgi:ribonuclease P protein component